MRDINHFIDGASFTGASGRFGDVMNPNTGEVQARVQLATEAEVLLADDVSSALDATTEIDLWSALRARGTTVIGATSKRAALGRADRVVVLVDGRVAEVGPWSALEQRWAHLAG